jgi:hypothetical protein
MMKDNGDTESSILNFAASVSYYNWYSFLTVCRCIIEGKALSSNQVSSSVFICGRLQLCTIYRKPLF